MKLHAFCLAPIVLALFTLGPANATAATPRPPAPPFATGSGNQLAAQASAAEIMAQAKERASAGHKNVLAVFSASWCGPCHLFERFLDDPAIHPIMDKSFVIARFDVGEKPGDSRHADTPGGEKLRASLGGAKAGYPYIIMLDASGRPIANSLRPDKHAKGGSNIGYPALPVEIDWFMHMLREGAPSLSQQETGSVRNWLRRNSPAERNGPRASARYSAD